MRMIGGEGMRCAASVLSAAVLAAGAAQAQAVRPSHAALPPPDPAANAAVQQTEYRIGPLDTLDINVFGVEDLTRTVQVDASGQINYPLIGAVLASTRTPRQLGDEIAARLDARYLQKPQVEVFVKSSLSQRFTVEGAVASPGVYDIQGRMTLLQAIATAKGLEDVANTRKVVVFRTVGGTRMAGVANLSAIRDGKKSDPQIYPGDVIVVASSRTKGWLRNIMGAVPIFNLLAL